MIAPLQVDVTGWLIAALSDTAPGTRFAGERPTDLAQQLPFVQVERVGGPNDNYILDSPTVAFGCFALDLPAANLAAYRVIAAVRALRGVVRNGAVITEVRTLSGPRRVENENPAVRHVAVLMQPRIKTSFT